jgi:exocyst complex component 1
MLKRMQKHLCEEEKLVGVAWSFVKKHFLERYRMWDGLVNDCYPSEALDPGIADVEKLFAAVR